MAGKSEKCIHAGHRERIRERLRTAGLEAFSEHEVLELLLTYAIPQKDVNPLAHELINTFGSLNAVFAADECELMQVKGVGKSAALMLNMIAQLGRYVQISALGEKPVICNFQQARAYCAPLFYGMAQEVCYMVCMDQAGHVLHRSLLHTGTVDQVSLHPRSVVELALRHNACSVLLAHNHPGGTAKPSQADVEMTRRISAALRMIDIHLVDHLIFADRALYSMNRVRSIEIGDKEAAFSYVQRIDGAPADGLQEAQYRWVSLMPADMEEMR